MTNLQSLVVKGLIQYILETKDALGKYKFSRCVLCREVVLFSEVQN